MTEIDPKNLEEMKRFLFQESPAAERDSLEERFFADEDFFYDLMELENSMVDAYARGELAGQDLKRFEASLERSPERREKIANAIALYSLIKKENQTVKNPVAVVETERGFGEKISSFFTLQMSARQYAFATLIFLLLGGTGFLLYERFRLNQELANLQENQKRVEELQKQEQILKDQLNENQKREQDLQTQINDKQGESEILNEQLEREKTERERLENELDRLKTLQKNLPSPKQTPNQPPKPTIITIVLSPFLGGRGGIENTIKTIKLDSNIKSVTATLQLPKDATAELVLVKFRGATIAAKQNLQTTKSGLKFVTVTIAAGKFSTGEDNIISVFGDNGVEYDFVLKVQK